MLKKRLTSKLGLSILADVRFQLIAGILQDSKEPWKLALLKTIDDAMFWVSHLPNSGLKPHREFFRTLHRFNRRPVHEQTPEALLRCIREHEETTWLIFSTKT